MHENLRSYMRLVEKRSREHNQAFGMLYAQGLYGACAAIIRQEIDNLIRVDYLAFSVPLADRDELCREALSGSRWQRCTAKGKLTDIRDVQFHTYAKNNHSWVSLAYEYSSKFIHLTNFWNYGVSDPLVTMPADDRSEMISYLSRYHGFPGHDLKINDLFEYLPQVFEKIRGNIECYVEQEDGLLLHPLSS
ncbi:hypothetical protein DL1_08340 [Thioclava dalianensis]|uniref:Uncharacterized protein n=1 Tax=Thioclava dalianensis TaxID=1185766 RepID=A0A074TB24_9RHOB|nr:hypothetical protein [Thioclava dalianensis]KEP68889.1 hypothetical protein DL1_08340 [Thioclava dalianensis]SFN22250.1 hypothetical protein SAMN05216224_10319 [Thioclava dalianensis]